jgi:hypothetical protein
MGLELSPKLVDTFLYVCPRIIVAELDVCVSVMEKATYNEVGQFSDEAQVVTRGCELSDPGISEESSPFWALSIECPN